MFKGDFDLQAFLRDMRSELKADISACASDLKTDLKRLEEKVDSSLTTQADHENRIGIIEVVPIAQHEVRLVKVEGVIKQLKYVVITVITGGFTGLIGILVSRFSGGITK